MEFVYEQKLQNYMLQKGKKNIVVEEIGRASCRERV